MTSVRPCDCGRIRPGRPYLASRDCHKCWLFAHRPAIRRAWGGDPADCAALCQARPNMPVAELADLLAEAPYVMPEGWRHWQVTRKAHLLLAERFLASLPAYPEGRFAGRGAVICGGGRYEASTYVCIKMLRHVGWRHPIQVWHRAPDEPVSDRLRRLPGVEVVDTEAHPARRERRTMGGWESKTLAIIHCPFEEVLFLDADCYPIFNPDECFEPRHNPHGIVTWPDAPHPESPVHWPTYGMEPDGGENINGGHYLFVKRTAWAALQLAAHYDNHSDYYYWRRVHDVRVGGFGDQEQVRVALRKLGLPHHQYAPRLLSAAFETFLQAGPHGRPLFVHRFANKFALPGRFPWPPRWYAGELPMEATAWKYFLEWLLEPETSTFPEEVPGLWTRAEYELWREFCRDRDVLELGRHHGGSTVMAALSARRVVSLDRTSVWEADLWLQRYGVRHKVWLREGEFADLIPTSGGPFTAGLIDGAHDRLNVEADIAVVVPHLAAGSVIAFHQYAAPAFPDVKPAADAAAARLGWQLRACVGHLAVFASG